MKVQTFEQWVKDNPVTDCQETVKSAWNAAIDSYSNYLDELSLQRVKQLEAMQEEFNPLGDSNDEWTIARTFISCAIHGAALRAK